METVLRISDAQQREPAWEKIVKPYLSGATRSIDLSTLPRSDSGAEQTEKREAATVKTVPVLTDLDNQVEPVLEGRPTQKDYLDRFHKQLEYCGEICSLEGVKPHGGEVSVKSLKESYISRPVRCERFFSKRAESIFDGPPLEWPPPRSTPFHDKFAFNGGSLGVLYLAQKYDGAAAHTPTWTKEMIEKDLALLKERKLHGT